MAKLQSSLQHISAEPGKRLLNVLANDDHEVGFAQLSACGLVLCQQDGLGAWALKPGWIWAGLSRAPAISDWHQKQQTLEVQRL